MPQDPIVIVSAKRTPIGSFQGALQDVPSPYLGAAAIKKTLDASSIDPTLIDQVIMGCVLSAGLGQAPARQATLHAGLPQKTESLTVNKVCGSGLKSVMLAHDLIQTNTAEIIIAGGMENMSGAPYLMPGARSGYRMGNKEVVDHMMFDGLQDAMSNGTSMGLFGEATAEKYGFTREQQDAFAMETARRAISALKSGKFKDEIAPVDVQTRKETITFAEDETPLKINVDKIPTLRPAFKKDGTLTAANSSSISDGAAALTLMRASKAKDLNLKPLAKIIAHAGYSKEPEWFTLAPSGAVKKVLAQAKWDIKDVDLFEINEAFAVVTMACMKDLGIDHDRVNIHGGACALGHPIGASGARILVTLLHALAQEKKPRGIATLCIGGGEAVAVAVEMF